MTDSVSSAPAAIELDHVGYRFGTTVALDDVVASLPAGVITGLVGPDAAGKTTLIRLMAGMLKPATGHIRVGGLDPIADGGRLRAVLGYMPQRFGLYEDLSVQENLDLYADLQGVVGPERQRQYQRLLEFTALAPFTARIAGALSGGMKQKLGLACVLLGRPRILLLDEPSVGVDPISRRELWRIVSNLAGEGITVLWSTSYLDEAERCAHVLLMHAGRLAFSGRPQVLANRVTGRTWTLAEPPGGPRAALDRVRRAPAVLDAVIQGSRLRLVTRAGAGSLTVSTLGLESGTLAPVAPRLEDAFIDILGGGPSPDSSLAALLAPVTLPGATATAVIEADALTKRFGSFTATNQISFRVPQGEIFGLLGPNGAGKSTTFKMLCGLLLPTAGSARILGLDLRREATRARQRLGYMAQKFSLYTTLTVAQNLTFFSGVYGVKGAEQARKIAAMVEAFGLESHLQDAAGDLPLGYKQRLALACALMHDPAILFLDEPTSGVDPVTRREFWTHINGLVQKGVTVLITTHFMDEAEYCDRIGLVYRGELIATGTPDALKDQARGAQHPDPTMEDAFIALVERHDAAHPERAAA